jgi:hypothetical protein
MRIHHTHRRRLPHYLLICLMNTNIEALSRICIRLGWPSHKFQVNLQPLHSDMHLNAFNIGVWCGGFAATFSLLPAKVYY